MEKFAGLLDFDKKDIEPTINKHIRNKEKYLSRDEARRLYMSFELLADNFFIGTSASQPIFEKIRSVIDLKERVLKNNISQEIEEYCKKALDHYVEKQMAGGASISDIENSGYIKKATRQKDTINQILTVQVRSR